MSQRLHCPLFVDLNDRLAIVVGGGIVAARKVEMLLRYGARVTVVAPDVSPEIASWAATGRISVQRKLYDPADLDGATLTIAATSDASVNAHIADECRQRGILVNLVQDPDLGTVIIPAVLEKGSVQIALSTGGRSPALARRLKADLDRAIGPEYAELNDLLGDLRSAARTTLPSGADRKRLFDAILDGGTLQLLREGRRLEALALIARLCEEQGLEAAAWLPQSGR